MRQRKHIYLSKIDYLYLVSYRKFCFFLRRCQFSLLFLLTGLIVISLGFPVCFSPAFGKDQKSVLVLHSYRPNYQWTDNINLGLSDVFGQYKDEVKLQTEYMDIKKGDDLHYFDLLKKLYLHKYKNTKFDSIVCSDNYALNFLLNNRNDLFKDTPIVFCGINRFKDSMLKNHKMVTGVVEDIDIEATLEIMSKLCPKMKRIVIWSVAHKRADQNRQEAVAIVKTLNPEVKVIHLRGESLENGLKTIKTLRNKDVVLLLSILRDENGVIIPAAYAAKQIAINSEAPIFSLFDIFLGHGIIGGKLVSGYSQGQSAAHMAMEIIGGRQADDISILKKSPNRYLFDADQLKKHKVEFSLIPAGSVIINREISFYEKYKLWIWGICVFIVFQTIVIVFLFYNLKRRKIVEAALKGARDNLEREVNERTQELQYSLSYNIAVTSSSPVGILVYDVNGQCNTVNKAAANIVGASIEQVKSQNFNELESWRKSGLLDSAEQSIREKKIIRKEIVTTTSFGKEVWMDCRFSPFESPSGLQLLLVVDDISDQKKLAKDREQLIRDLQTTLAEVKTLRGFLPICANCKKVRDDKGYWQQIETYISKHSSAEFSHGICPECAKKLYPELNIYPD